MKYTWIESYRDEYRVTRMCRLLEVSRTGYLQWRSRPCSDRTLASRALDAQVAAIHAASKRIARRTAGTTPRWRASTNR